MIRPMAASPGAELALLLLTGFHSMTDEVIAELAERGHDGVRPVHEFALRAIDSGAETASDLGRRMDVSKQAAAKTIAALQRLEYVVRETDPDDARRKRLRVTPRGHEMMALGGELFDQVRDRWAAQIGARRLTELESDLARLTGRPPASTDALARLDDGRPAQPE